jgi:hypothetical protein
MTRLPTRRFSTRGFASPSRWPRRPAVRCLRLGLPNEEERSALGDAKDFLLGELADGIRHPTKNLFKEARKQGISERTLQRARPAVGAEREKAGFGRGWEWWLPKAPSSSHAPAFLREVVNSRGLAPSAPFSSNGQLDDRCLDDLDADLIDRGAT